MKRNKGKLAQATGRLPDSNEACLSDVTTEKMFPGKTPRLDSTATNDESFNEPPA